MDGSREETNGITQDLLLELFNYKDGKLLYKKRLLRRKIFEGDEAGCLNSKGYRSIKINGLSYKTHRLIFLFHKGYLPKMLDHINGIRDSNKIENLRPCNQKQNSANSRTRNDSFTGVKGLNYYSNSNKPWKARVMKDGIYIIDRFFYEKEEAILALNVAREQLGGFANNG